MLDGGGASIERIACKKCLESHVYPRKTLGLKLQRAKRTKICEHLTSSLDRRAKREQRDECLFPGTRLTAATSVRAAHATEGFYDTALNEANDV
jgi:hypothetical protein